MPLRKRLVMKICNRNTPDPCEQPEQKYIIYAHLAHLSNTSLLGQHIVCSMHISQYL